jgi:acetyl-CoA carboxylase/biotin carboxylase 1
MFDVDEFTQRYGNNQPPNVMNLALRIFDKTDDVAEETRAEQLAKFLNDRNGVLAKRGVRRVTILICRRGQYPMYFTLRNSGGSWVERQAIRNIQPALAFQLELGRLFHYKLTPCSVETKQIHIYHAIARENQLDNRFFIRALIRPGRLRGSMSTAEYLVSETDRLVTSVLDALEAVSAQHRNTDVNHIFMNFVYNLGVSYEDVLTAIAGFIERHEKRLWRLHVTGSEIRIALEDSEGNVTPIRCIIENVSGFVVNFHGYQEITADKGTTILKSIGEKGASPPPARPPAVPNQRVVATQALSGASYRYHLCL